MSMLKPTTVFGIAATVAALTMTQPADARWRADWELAYYLLFTDNIERVPFDEEDEFVHIPRFSLFLTEDTGRLTGQVNLSVERRFYQDDTFDDEDRNAVDLDLLWRVVDGRLNWVFENDLREQPINVRVNDRPDNLQQVNVFSTGPDFVFRLGRNVDGLLRARFTDTYAEETDRFNSERAQVGAGLERSLTENTKLRMTSTFSDVDFDEGPEEIDYISRAYYGTIEHLRRRDTFTMDLGWAEADGRAGQMFDVDDVLFDAAWTRSDGKYEFTLSAFHGITSLSQTIGATALSDSGSVVTSRVTERDSLGFRYSYQLDRGSWQASASYSDDDFVGEDEFDRKQTRFGLRYSRPLTPRSEAQLFLNYYKAEFTAFPFQREDDRTEVGARYQKAWTPHVQSGLEVRFADQSSDNPLIEYDEVQVAFIISYRRNPIESAL